MSYVTSTEFAAYVRSTVVGVDDALLAGALAAAHAAVNSECGRTFDLAGVTATSRSFRSVGTQTLTLDDFVGAPVVTVDGAVVDADDYVVFPLNARADDGVSVAQWRLVALSGCPWVSSTGVISVSARWGWPSVPDAVKEATLLLGKDEVHLRDTRFGVASFDQFGGMRSGKNWNALSLLASLRRGDRAPAFVLA